MIAYKTVYPIFEEQVSKLIFHINRELEFGRYDAKSILFLQHFKNALLQLHNSLLDNPSFNSANFGACVNDLVSKDKELNVVTAHIILKENPNLGKSGYVEFNCARTWSI